MNDAAPRRIGAITDDAPDLAPPTDDERRAPSVGQSLLAALDAALEADVVKEPVTYPVTMRPGLSIRYSTDIDDDKMTVWRNRAKKRGRRGQTDEVDSLTYCALILATQCEAFLIRGQEPHDDAGQPFTFGHRHIREKYHAEKASEAVIAVFGNDAHVLLTANELLEKAGFGDEVVEVEGEADSL